MSGQATSPSHVLAILRTLRAPLAVLCALLLVASMVPHAMAGTVVCTGWGTSLGAGDGDGTDEAECPFCSAATLALPRADAALPAAPAMIAEPPLPEAITRTVRARAPPMGPRAPPRA